LGDFWGPIYPPVDGLPNNRLPIYGQNNMSNPNMNFGRYNFGRNHFGSDNFGRNNFDPNNLDLTFDPNGGGRWNGLPELRSRRK